MAPAQASSPARHGFTGRLQEIAERAELTVDELLDFLDSPTGRRLRGALAMGMIVSVPLIMRIPGLRHSPVGRVVRLVGGGAIVVKLAELIRDWERDEARDRRRARAVDVPPVPPAP